MPDSLEFVFSAREGDDEVRFFITEEAVEVSFLSAPWFETRVHFVPSGEVQIAAELLLSYPTATRPLEVEVTPSTPCMSGPVKLPSVADASCHVLPSTDVHTAASAGSSRVPAAPLHPTAT